MLACCNPIEVAGARAALKRTPNPTKLRPKAQPRRLAASSRIQIGGHQHGFGGIERADEPSRIRTSEVNNQHGRIALVEKERLGRVSKMGNGYLRSLIVVGATAMIRYAREKGAVSARWINALLEKKPARLANTTARIAWALLVRKEDYRVPLPA